LYGNALTTFQEALRLAEQSEDTVSIIFKSRDIAEQYKFMNINDSCLYYYQAALQLAKEVGNIDRITELNSQIARFYKDQGQYHLARKYMQPAIDNFDSLNISSTYSILSDIYKNTNKFDSAYIYYNKLLQYGNIYGKCNAYKGLCELQLKKGNVESAYNYLSQYKLLDDSIRKMDNAETVARMHAAYNYQKHEREAHELKAKNDRMRVYLLLLSSAVVVMLLLAGLVVLLRRYKRQLVQSSMGKTDLLRYSYEQKTEQQKLSEREQVAGSTIYAAIQSHLGKAGDVPLSDDEWQQLHQTVNAVYPNFREKLTSLTPMNNFEYQVCLLLKIGVKPSDIASLTAHSRESVTSSRRRLYEKAMKKSGKPSDWDALVTIL
jgi:hypothetical protein